MSSDCEMDFQNRVGSKTGGGGPASASESNRDRRERLAALAAETIDLAKVIMFVIIVTGLTDYFPRRTRILCEITWERLSASCA